MNSKILAIKEKRQHLFSEFTEIFFKSSKASNINIRGKNLIALNFLITQKWYVLTVHTSILALCTDEGTDGLPVGLLLVSGWQSNDDDYENQNGKSTY